MDLVQLFNFGNNFLNVLGRVSNFLSTPLPFINDVFNTFIKLIKFPFPDLASLLENYLGGFNFTIIGFVFGNGLIALLLFKLAKFILDIVL